MERSLGFRGPGRSQTGLTPPPHEYDHTSADTCSGSVTGGYMYRGSELTGLQELYFGATSATMW
jgi:hypothetical protein